MNRFTLDDIMNFCPCDGWPRERIAALIPACGYVTALDVLNCADVLDKDAIWLVARMITPRDARLFACEVAERAIDAAEKRGHKIYARSREAIAVSRRYAVGDATVDELSAACAATRYACAAACDAACDAADAAYDAACDAAWDAAYNAAYNAACDAADAADAAYNAAWVEYRKLLLNYIHAEFAKQEFDI